MLAQMQNLALQNVGKVVTMPWERHGEDDGFLLEAIYEQGGMEMIGRRTGPAAEAREMKWTFYRLREDQLEQLWCHRTGDVLLIVNLLSFENGDSVSHLNESAEAHSSVSPSTVSQIGLDSAAPLQRNLDQTSEHEKGLLHNVALAGTLAETDLAGVLQSISICKMTGRLDIQDRIHHAELYFDNGVLVHGVYQKAVASGDADTLIGDQVLLDVLTWEHAEYLFHKSRKTSETTIKRKLEALLLTGMVLADYSKYLHKHGITLDTVLQKPITPVSDSEFEQRLDTAVAVDHALQKKFYDEIDGKATLESIVERLNLTKSAWLPIVFNFVSSELVGSGEIGKVAAEKSKAVQIDYSAMNHAARQLVRPDTGMFSYPLALHFLNYELSRSRYTGSPLAIVILEITNRAEPLDNAQLQQISAVFDGIKRDFDMLGHSQTFDFIMILPIWKDEHARAFCSTFANALLAANITGVAEPGDLHMSFGVASGPRDGIDLETLLGAANQAKETAKSCSVSCVTARDLRWEQLMQEAEKAFKSSNISRAELMYSQALKEAGRFARNDERFYQTVSALVHICNTKNSPQSSEALLNKAIHDRSSLQGDGDVVARLRNDLAKCLYSQAKYSEAEAMLEHLIDELIPQVGLHHPIVIDSVSNLATTYHVQQKLDKALETYKKALAIRTSVFGPDHPDTVSLANNLSKLTKTIEAIQKRDGGASVITGTWTNAWEKEKKKDA
jgi:GGDEF domain-containing protein